MWRPDIEQIADAVKNAPSIFNSQPWSIKIAADDRIDLYVNLSELGEEDRKRWDLCPGRNGTRRLDPLAREFAISCGAALYNLRLAIRVSGHDLTVRLPPHRTRDSTLLASVEIVIDKIKPPTIAEQELYEAIWRRPTNRWPNAPAPLPIIVAMENAARQEGASLRLLRHSQARKWLRLAAAADRYLETEPNNLPQVAHERYQRRQEHRYRYRAREDSEAGVPGATPGPAGKDRSLTRKPFRRPDEELPLERRPQLLALSTDDDQLLDWLRAGQGLQHAILVGTRYSVSPPYGLAAKYQAPLRYGIPVRHHLLRRHDDLAFAGLSVSFLSQPIERYDIEHENGQVKPPPRPMPWRFAELPQVVIRVGYAARLAHPAPRRQPDVLDTRLQPLGALPLVRSVHPWPRWIMAGMAVCTVWKHAARLTSRRPARRHAFHMASTRAWFETVAEAQRRARRRLPRSVYMAVIAGAEAGVTMNDNVDAFAELRFRPHVAELPAARELSTTVMGQQISLPVLISPTGVQAVHPDGEVAVARAATAAGTAMGLSSFASKPVEEVGRATDKLLFQSYWIGGRDDVLARAERARAAGAKGLIVTLDWVFDSRRDWGSPWIPEHLDLAAMVRHVPQVVFKPAYLARWVRSGSLPDLGVPNLGARGAQIPSFFGAYGEWMNSAPPTWDDLAWLREQWGGAFMIKGITRPDDARRAADIGATAISVSNHGGNNLDSTLATIRCLPAIVDAVGDRLEVLLDGGIRRGSDVVKAVALGACAVMIGRAYLWGLAASGERGVSNVLEILRQGISETLYGLGKASIHDLARDDVVVPDGFTLGRKL